MSGSVPQQRGHAARQVDYQRTKEVAQLGAKRLTGHTVVSDCGFTLVRSCNRVLLSPTFCMWTSARYLTDMIG
jgi:hypothetical protein